MVWGEGPVESALRNRSVLSGQTKRPWPRAQVLSSSATDLLEQDRGASAGYSRKETCETLRSSLGLCRDISKGQVRCRGAVLPQFVLHLVLFKSLSQI